MKGWDGLINSWQKSFFSIPFYLFLSAFALVVCIIFHRREKIGFLFFAYLLFDIVISCLDDYNIYFSKLNRKESSRILNLSNGLIYIIEFFVYSFFFFFVLKYKSSKKTLILLLLLFCLASAYYLGVGFSQQNNLYIRKLSNFLAALEYLFLVIISLLYYFELFTLEPKDDLLKKPSFWVTSGIFIMALLSLPYILVDFTLVFNKVFNHTLTVFFYYMPICFNSIFLTKALLCKKPLSI